MASVPVEIAGLTFPSFTEAKAYFDQLREEAPKNRWLDSPMFCAIYDRDPAVTFPVRAVRFERHGPGRNGWGAVVRGEYGETYQYASLKHVFRRESLSARVHRKMRRAIYLQTVEYRQDMLEGGGLCDLCQEASGEDADHRIPFVEIVEDWLLAKGLSYSDIRFVKVTDDGLLRLDPVELQLDWERYHLERCEWQWVCKPCHKKKTAEQRRRPWP